MSNPLANELVKRMTELLSLYSEAFSKSRYDDLSDLDPDYVTELVTRWLNMIESVAPASSSYVKAANKAIEEGGTQSSFTLKRIYGVLNALCEDTRKGYTQPIQEIVHADLFADWLEMARHLLDKGYKDAAAVIVGSVLETQLRKLCVKHNVNIALPKGPKKADAMNSDLANGAHYSKLIQKDITAWLGLRNSAAHGKYSEYTNEQVTRMLSGVSDFVKNFPA